MDPTKIRYVAELNIVVSLVKKIANFLSNSESRMHQNIFEINFNTVAASNLKRIADLLMFLPRSEFFEVYGKNIMGVESWSEGDAGSLE